ncbi:hypothetical protein C4556_00100 [Candidatus Parcubacteria bacterium]|nr:MAG: hypothetical protein C4556_00100 [Candidatus Parcubacteria bacterium]
MFLLITINNFGKQCWEGRMAPAPRTGLHAGIRPVRVAGAQPAVPVEVEAVALCLERGTKRPHLRLVALLVLEDEASHVGDVLVQTPLGVVGLGGTGDRGEDGSDTDEDGTREKLAHLNSFPVSDGSAPESLRIPETNEHAVTRATVEYST